MSRGQQAYAWGLAIVAVVALVASGATPKAADLVFPAAFATTAWICLTLAHREPSTRSRLAIAAAVSLLIGLASFYLTGNPFGAGLTAAGSALAIALLPPALAENRKKARPEL